MADEFGIKILKDKLSMPILFVEVYRLPQKTTATSSTSSYQITFAKGRTSNYV
jgi:hypothetical protein